jgi:DNA mismatch repair protein MutL
MSNIIHLLPDSIANQIAAGEVIQRPASVVKELVENAIDAGADAIQVHIKDAGRTLVQVIDNGKGMSGDDALLSFERHATSKIQTANDLFALRTMGFRGEALASIAAVAQVELKTRRPEDETGTLICIAASQLETQETIAASVGSNFAVKNLFFNVPARRKFLKSNDAEFRNILTEVERAALVYPHIAFTLRHNEAEALTLPPAGLKQRIIAVMGKKIAQQLLPIDIRTTFITITGFVGAPESSKQRGAAQYFFTNGRYMRHPYFHRAVALAFEPYIPAGSHPNYFIYMEIDPASIDVNIHPTKTEIKFEDEQMLFQVLTSAVKEAIAIPGLEFDREGAIDIPVYSGRPADAHPPKLDLRSDYNPFKDNHSHAPSTAGWEQLYQPPTAPAEAPLLEAELRRETILQFKDRYLVTTLASGLAIIDKRRAHLQLFYDDYKQRMAHRQRVSQQLLFPEIITFTPREATILPFLLESLTTVGFDLADLGGNSYSINGIPAGTEAINPVETLQEMVDKALETGCEVQEEIDHALILALARRAAMSAARRSLTSEEAQSLIARIFSSQMPGSTPDGKTILILLSESELEKRFTS